MRITGKLHRLLDAFEREAENHAHAKEWGTAKAIERAAQKVDKARHALLEYFRSK